MPALQDRQNRWLSLLKVLIGLYLALFVWFAYSTIHYDNISPTVADEASGHIYPRYDKFHGRYVYLDKTAKDAELDWLWILAGSFLCLCPVVLKVKRLISSSQKVESNSFQRPY
jgi:hypothetical protein